MPIYPFPLALPLRPISPETLRVLGCLEVEPIIEEKLLKILIAIRQYEATLVPLTPIMEGTELFSKGAVLVSATDVCSALTKKGFIKARDEIAPIAYPTDGGSPVYFLLPPDWKTAWSNKKT